MLHSWKNITGLSESYLKASLVAEKKRDFIFKVGKRDKMERERVQNRRGKTNGGYFTGYGVCYHLVSWFGIFLFGGVGVLGVFNLCVLNL